MWSVSPGCRGRRRRGHRVIIRCCVDNQRSRGGRCGHGRGGPGRTEARRADGPAGCVLHPGGAVAAGRQVRAGLMSDLPRKNCWTLAEYAGDRTPDRMQRLLQRASWNTFEAMDTVRDFVVEHLADPEGLTVLVLDESGDEKTGTHTAGVKRQYVGCAGKVANAVKFVNATYSTPRGQPVVLVAHSNAGLFVPVVVHALDVRSPAACSSMRACPVVPGRRLRRRRSG